MSLDNPSDLEPGVRFEPFARAWFNTYVKANTRPSTQIGYWGVLRRALLPYFGMTKLEDITTLMVEAFKVEQLGRGDSPKSINNMLAVLRRSLVCAEEWGILAHIPRVKFPRTPASRFKFLTRNESEALLRSEDRPEWKLFFLTALKTGMRTCELLALRWEDVDLEIGQIHVRRSLVAGVEGPPKNGRTRFIPLTNDLYAALEERRKESGYVFAQTGGQPLTWSQAYRALQEACREAGIKRVGLHALRHSFTTQLAQKRVSIRLVKELLGHSTLVMTERYMHLEERELRRAMASLSLAS